MPVDMKFNIINYDPGTLKKSRLVVDLTVGNCGDYLYVHVCVLYTRA